jgi:hypothetical protein
MRVLGFWKSIVLMIGGVFASSAFSGSYTCPGLGSIAVDDAVIKRVAGYRGGYKPTDQRIAHLIVPENSNDNRGICASRPERCIQRPVEAQVYRGEFSPADGGDVQPVALISDWRQNTADLNNSTMYVWATGPDIQFTGFMTKPGEWIGHYKTNRGRKWRPVTCSVGG